MTWQAYLPAFRRSGGDEVQEPQHPWASDTNRGLPSGELTFCYGKSPFLLGKSTISMAMFNSKLLVYQRVSSMKMVISLDIVGINDDVGI